MQVKFVVFLITIVAFLLNEAFKNQEIDHICKLELSSVFESWNWLLSFFYFFGSSNMNSGCQAVNRKAKAIQRAPTLSTKG